METAEIRFETEDIGSSRVKIRFTVPYEKVKSATDKVYDTIKSSATIRGFRPGKAPRPMVEKQYAAYIRERAFNQLLPEAFFTAMKEKNLRPVADPAYNDVQYEPGQPLTFTAITEVIQEFKLPDYKGIEIKKAESKEPTDDEVQQVLNMHLEHLAKYEPVEDRAVQEGDFVLLDINQEIEGKKSSQKNQMVEMNREKTLPVFVDNLAGKKSQEKVQFDYAFPADYKSKTLAGKTAHFEVDLLEIKKKVLPNLDDDFAKDTGMADSLEAMKENIRKSLREDNQEKARAQEENQIVDFLVNNTEIQVPPSVLQAQTEDNYRRILQYSLFSGATKEDLMNRKDEIQKTAAEDSIKQVKAFLILQEIAEKESIEVSEEELNARIAEIARSRGTDVAKLESEMEKNEEKNSIRNRIAREKVIKYLYDNAKMN